MSDIYPRSAGDSYAVEEFFSPGDTEASEVARTSDGRRLVARHSGGALQMRLDLFADLGVACCFARIGASSAAEVSLILAGSYGVVNLPAGGWLVRPLQADLSSYWIPRPPVLRRLDASGHIVEERVAAVSGFACSPSQADLRVTIPAGWLLDCVLWRLPSSSQVAVGELERLHPQETQAQFLWGSHTLYRRPADVYLHLVHGHVYENRATWPKHWRICSENDAHALYTVLGGLQQATGKRLYGLLKRQLVLSVLDRQGEDGAWRHGEWSNRMESHLRLHCSAMHMLLDALAERDDPAIESALWRAANFLAQQVDRLDVGKWLLHDELERSVETLQEGPFRWLPSRALGKSPSNMLVLNSHLDGTIALDRYRETTADGQHEALVEEARRATRAVMSLQPANWLYALIFRGIRLTFLPTAQASRLPAHLRALKRLARNYLVPVLPSLKARFPRLVMPGGYVDRELSLRVLAHDYLPINLMDLLRYKRRFAGDVIDDVVHAGFNLIDDCRMFERWPEIGKAYAIAFWAEALYQACLTYPDAEYRLRLAQAVRELEARGLGLPPSLLGANREAVGAKGAAPVPLPEDAELRVVNLCAEEAFEVLFVNCADVSVGTRLARDVPPDVVWTLGAEGAPLATLPAEIPAQGWLWGRRRSPREART